MTKLIVSAFAALLDTLLLLLLLLGAIAAYQFIPDAVFGGDFYAYKNVLKIVFGLAGTFILEVLFIGPFLVLEDIRKAVRAIDGRIVTATRQ